MQHPQKYVEAVPTCISKVETLTLVILLRGNFEKMENTVGNVSLWFNVFRYGDVFCKEERINELNCFSAQQFSRFEQNLSFIYIYIYIYTSHYLEMCAHCI